MTSLIVFNQSIDALDQIDDYVSLLIERKYDDVSKLVLRIEYSERNVTLLQKGNILADYNNATYGYFIDHFSVVSENGILIIEVFAYSLNYWLEWRITPRQQTYQGNPSDAIRSYVSFNMINSLNPNRNINNLILGSSVSGLPSSFFSSTGDNLKELIFEICNQYGITADINMNLTSRNFVFNLSQGFNRSINQSQRNAVVFSVELDNVLNFEYFDSDINLKNVIYTAGEGIGGNRTLNLINSSTYTGINRREYYVDARDLQREYQDENGNQVTLSVQEYDTILGERGLQRSTELTNIRSYESTIDDTQFTLGVHYNLGDIVTIYDRTLNITQDVRVTQVTIRSVNGVTTMQPSFGTGVPRRLKGGF